MQLFDNRAGLDLAWYTKKTSNQILTAERSERDGLHSALVNAGEISNKGIEAQFNVTPISRPTRRLRWDVTANYGWNRNRVDALYGDLQTVRSGHALDLSIEARKGSAVRLMFGVGFGVTRRRTRFCSRDGTPAAGGVEPEARPRQIHAELDGGLDNTFRYTGVRLRLPVRHAPRRQGVQRGNMWGSYSGVLARPHTVPTRASSSRASTRRRARRTRSTSAPRTTTTRCIRSRKPWIYDASFVKLREARFGFDGPERYLSGAPASSMRISRSSAATSSLWTNVPNIDPETAFSAEQPAGHRDGPDAVRPQLRLPAHGHPVMRADG